MKVELSIADDRELRSHIKDVIKGEVTSIARGEIRGIIAEVVKEGVVPSNQNDIDRIVREIVVAEVKTVLKSSTSFSSGSTVITSIAREEIQKLIRELFEKGSILT